MSVAEARFSPSRSDDDTAEKIARLSARVGELEHLLELERARNAGLERGLSALSERVVDLRERTSSSA
jgi:hypothetical protein